MDLFCHGLDQSPSQAPACPSCGGRDWEACRPRRLGKGHPQDRPGPGWRAFKAGAVAAGACCALGAALAVAMGLGCPAWGLWGLGSAILGAAGAGVVAVDGLSTEARSCALACRRCGDGFVAPWRPSP
jgi:hypothetical protein